MPRKKPKPLCNAKPPPPSASHYETSEPYPDFRNPTPDQCTAVRDALLSLHGFPAEFAGFQKKRTATKQSAGDGGTEGETVLDGLVSTLLSQNTTGSNSARAFLSLKSAFPTWDQVLAAETGGLEDAIRCGGLARTKAARIKCILEDLMEKSGALSLEYLRGMRVDEVKVELARFKGIGPKTMACVLMFNLQQDDFPVDTHVLRITKAISWVPTKADREKAYLHLNSRIPDELKFDLNCLLFTHGKNCHLCTKKGGNQLPGAPHAPCPLTRYH